MTAKIKCFFFNNLIEPCLGWIISILLIIKVYLDIFYPRGQLNNMSWLWFYVNILRSRCQLPAYNSHQSQEISDRKNSILFKEDRMDVIVLSQHLRIHFRIKKWLGFFKFDVVMIPEIPGIWRYEADVIKVSHWIDFNFHSP